MLPIPSLDSLNSILQPLSTSKGKRVGGTDLGGSIGLRTMLYNVCPFMILPSGTFQPLSTSKEKSVGGTDHGGSIDTMLINACPAK